MIDQQISSQQIQDKYQAAIKYIEDCAHGTPDGVLPEHECLDEPLLAQCLQIVEQAEANGFNVPEEDRVYTLQDLIEQTAQATQFLFRAGFHPLQTTQNTLTYLERILDMKIELDPLTGME